MPVTAAKKKVQEKGLEKDALIVSFTNGAKAQVEELQKFINAGDPIDVIKLGISFVQRLKEIEDQKKEDNGEKETSS